MDLEGILLLFIGCFMLVSSHENPRDFNNVVGSNHEDDHGAPAHGHGGAPPSNQGGAPPSKQGGAPPPNHGGAPTKRPPPPPRDNKLRDKTHTQNQQHVKEHLEGRVQMDQSQMSEEELQFHYFKLHDYDNNNRLDGIELISAVTHFHDDPEDILDMDLQDLSETDPKEKDDEGSVHRVNTLPDTEIEQIVDNIMRDEDRNNDGYIDYSEFVRSQRGQPSNL